MKTKRIARQVIGWASISIQQGRESADAAYAAAGTSISGHKTAQSLNDQATRVDLPEESLVPR